MPREPSADHRVLVCAPIGRDGVLTEELLTRAAMSCVVCHSLEALARELRDGVGAIIVTEEALESEPEVGALSRALRHQPVWSDIPLVLFCSHDRRSEMLEPRLPDALQHATLVERPIGVAAVSIVRTAIRARRRQYEVRDLLTAVHDARCEAEAASRLKDEFLATLSHELRTPLNAILGWTTMLRQGQVGADQVGRVLEVVHRNGQAQAKLIEDVLDMSQIITGRLRLALEAVSLPGMIESAIDVVQPAAVAKRVRLVVEVGEAETLQGDPARLRQVFWNLLSNAVRFTPAGGEIRVSLSRQGVDLIVTVTDTGIGIAPDFLPFVFDRFRQANQTASRPHGGLGLGLAIVKQLVESHGGRVEVQSAGVGCGCTFLVCLPLSAA